MNVSMKVSRLAIDALTKPRPIPNPFGATLEERVRGRTVLITGASSGIGRRLAERVADAGAHAIVVARRKDELDELVREIKQSGGNATAVASDLSTEDGVTTVTDIVLGEFGAPDILVNNAARSIFRSIERSAAEDRLHDYERTMRVNYLAGVGLALKLLPAMASRGSGHVVHSSSIGVLMDLPRFSAYVGSKAALDAFYRVAANEYADTGITFTNVHLPLVRTSMAAGEWDSRFAVLSLDEGTEMLVTAIRRRPHRYDNPLGSLSAKVREFLPGSSSGLLNSYHRSVPDTEWR
ncbi:SDR family NAD(P)-dependent oxidoreductase [Mycolicibacterium litorale]|uniref:SDR family NAD(P)-dependent oxidoreductase n=1 Tax=Mycolicibacterium litorale TaxID=758802 RepID=UPI003CF48CD4